MKNKIPYTIISLMLISKIFAWWLLVWGIDYGSADLTLESSFKPAHQISYMVLSSFLVIGVILKSKFALYAFFGVFIINLIIYILNGSIVYQSLYDPTLLILFYFVINKKQPNSWLTTKELTNVG